MKKNIQTKRKSPKAKNKRSRSKFPALEPKYNLKSRAELFDYDYIDKLSDKEKEWLNTFSEEFNNANFRHGKKILHKSKALKKDCYGMNNRRNRDILTREKAQGLLLYTEELLKETNGEIIEELGDTSSESDDET